MLERELKSAFFLLHLDVLIQRIEVPVDTLFLNGAIERALDLVLSASGSWTPEK